MALPTIVRHGDVSDTIEFNLPNGSRGFAVVVTKPLALAPEITAAIIRRYNHHQHLVRLLLRLSDAVEALEGTSDTADQLVDEYRAILSGLGS